MVETDGTILTERQLEVLERRESGATQRAVAEELGTTASNVSAIERAAEANVEKARRTLELVRALRAPVQFTVAAGASFDDLVTAVYDHGDEAGVKIAYCRPELYAHLYGLLADVTDANQLTAEVTVGLTEDGDVTVYADEHAVGSGGDSGSGERGEIS
ncbi:Tfx family DNA-binding protein [Haloarcula salinisoli]|uniref:Tfx family DNA-binding protein n=1 Tax=Haloarcula salinisoli TaxID=2487746 RepID=A0A8J8CA11_9EURY|nr:Tfx family DNA-binding protein [Halomicroarcula salinisoli]MBX0288423.1 Tfx family DNA-binding protein [Halomicroarcula salinisoli]MBX0305907.1 Tfx family DNA-binding protein [Halomicroarcula salinisoli]